MAIRGLALSVLGATLFVCSFAADKEVANTTEKPFDILNCWPHDYIYPNPQPECDESCQCTFTASSGRIYTPLYSEADPKSKMKFLNIDVPGSDVIIVRFDRGNFTLGISFETKNVVQVGKGTVRSVSDITPDNIMETIDSSDWTNGTSIARIGIFGSQMFVAFYCLDDIGNRASFFEYWARSMQYHTELLKSEDPTIIEPPLNDDGNDYLLATTKTWKLSGQPGKTWEINVLSLDISPSDDLLFGTGDPKDIQTADVTIIDATSVGKSFHIQASEGFVKFRSTVHNEPSTGFALEVKQVPVEAPSQLEPGSSCNLNGCNYTQLSGVIDLSFFLYLSNPILGSKNLTFRISGPQDSKVIIRFNRIGEDPNPDAILEPGDKVSIGYGGPEAQTPSKESLRAWFRTFSHLVHVEPNLVQIPIPYDNAWILIDEKGEKPEYAIEYEIIPPTIAEEILDEAGPVALLPPYDSLKRQPEPDYASNAKWLWRLVTPKNETQSGVRWVVKVKNFHLDEDSKDFVEFGRGQRPAGVNENIVLRAYGIMDDREIVIDSPDAYIYMESNLHVKPMPGFDLSVKRVYSTESNDIRDHDEPSGSNQPVLGQKATKCWPDENPPSAPLPQCTATCECLYTATESVVYTPMFSETSIAFKRKFQNVQVPGADFLMLYMNNKTFFVDNDQTGQPNQRSKNTVAFGEGQLAAFFEGLPTGTVQQFAPVMDYGPDGEIRVPILNNSAFGNYFYSDDGKFPNNTKAYFSYKAFTTNYTVQNVMEGGPMNLQALMDDSGEDYALAQDVVWRLMGQDGNSWNITVLYTDIDWNSDTLAIGPGSMPPEAGNNDWPTYILLDMNIKKPQTFIIDNPTAFISFRSTLHVIPRRGFSLEVTRLGDGVTELPNITTSTEVPLPMTPQPGARVERTFLMLDLDFSLHQISGSNSTAGEEFLAKLVDAVVTTCNEFDKYENLSLAEPVVASHIDAVVRSCGSCFDKNTCAQTTVRVTVSNLDGYYAFTSDTLARMLSEKYYKDFFHSKIGATTRLNLHCDFTWWYWALAGVTFFAAVVSTIAWRMNQKSKTVKKSQIMASSDSAFFSQGPEQTKLNGMMEGGFIAPEVHYNAAFTLDEDDEESEADETLYDRETVSPRLVPGSGVNGDDRLVEPT